MMIGLTSSGQIYSAAPNLMNVCIDKNFGKEIKGRCYNRYSQYPVQFDGMNHLLIRMDQLMDNINFPQSSTRSRGFFNRQKCKEDGGMEKVKTTEEILKESGKKATFVVNVAYRQNATWQGKVLWAETGQSCYFRSALELMKLIDNALDEGEEPENQQEWS